MNSSLGRDSTGVCYSNHAKQAVRFKWSHLGQADLHSTALQESKREKMRKQLSQISPWQIEFVFMSVFCYFCSNQLLHVFISFFLLVLFKYLMNSEMIGSQFMLRDHYQFWKCNLKLIIYISKIINLLIKINLWALNLFSLEYIQGLPASLRMLIKAPNKGNCVEYFKRYCM